MKKTEMDEIKRHMSALSEEFQSRLSAVAEMTGSIAEDVSEIKLELTVVKADISELKTDMTVVKADISELKTDMTVVKADISELKTDMTVVKKEIVIVKSNTEIIKDGLNQKVNYEEFFNLEKRLPALQPKK